MLKRTKISIAILFSLGALAHVIPANLYAIQQDRPEHTADITLVSAGLGLIVMLSQIPPVYYSLDEEGALDFSRLVKTGALFNYAYCMLFYICFCMHLANVASSNDPDEPAPAEESNPVIINIENNRDRSDRRASASIRHRRQPVWAHQSPRTRRHAL